jgi:hypothetical protein
MYAHPTPWPQHQSRCAVASCLCWTPRSFWHSALVLKSCRLFGRLLLIVYYKWLLFVYVHRVPLHYITSAHNLMVCWPCIVVYQYSETSVMHFLFKLLRIKCLYMFRASLAYPQEALYKRHLLYCVRVMSVGCYQGWSGTRFLQNSLLCSKLVALCGIECQRFCLKHSSILWRVLHKYKENQFLRPWSKMFCRNVGCTTSGLHEGNLNTEAKYMSEITKNACRTHVYLIGGHRFTPWTCNAGTA